MRLRGLRIQGFKSFADRTELSFPDGITCIVGPNGCGKSNVVDAMKWVLGEQRASALRGGEMADVIFSGTANRKPVSLAEVSLLIDNSEQRLGVEWSEVEVTRRLYRDGTSEYLLNRNPCRLRDLRELLMDTGSGPGALTFMEQGRIDQILRESQQDRRLVFEEAAGIAKYKARRKESLRQLERVEADLLRISDVVAEKERLVRSLRIQAGRAERYQALVDEMRRKRLVLAVHRYGALLGEREAATAHVADLVTREDLARAQVRDAVSACRKVEEDLELRRAAVSRSEQEIASLEGQSEAAREKSTFAARLAAELDGKIRWYAGEIEGSATRLRELSTVRDEVGASLAEGKSEHEQRRAALVGAEQAALAARAEATERRAGVQRLAERSYATLSRHSQLSNRRSKLEASAQSLAEQGARIGKRLESLQGEASAAAERLSRAEGEAEAAGTRVREGSAALVAGEERVSSLESALRALRDRVSALDRDVSSTRSRVDVLRSLSARMEGVGEGARRLLQDARKGEAALRGVRGLLVEMLETDAAHAAVVETALGAFATAVVVETFDDAERAIAYVEQKKLGRCTFLPLDAVVESVAEVASAGDGPAEGPGDRVAQFVRCADDLRPAVRALLADAVAVHDLAGARARRAEGLTTGARVRVVTSGGAVLEPSGALSAGGAPGGAGILQRRTELRDLTARLEEAVSRLEAARVELASTETALVEARREVTAAREAVRAAEGALHRSRSDVERARADAGRADAERTRLAREVAEIDAHRERVREESASLDADIAALATEQAELEAARAEAARRAEESERALRAAEDVRSDARVHLASVVERCKSLASRVEAVDREMTELEQGVAEDRQELAACEKRRHEAEERGREAHKAYEAAQKKRDRCIQELTLQRHQAASAHTALEENRKLLEGLEAAASGVSQELHRLRMRENEARMRVENLMDRIRDDLGLDLHEAWAASHAQAASRNQPAPAEGPVYAEAGSEGAPALDTQAMEVEVADLKSKIERMGAVNLEALGQLQDAEREAERLQTQHTDLTKSRESLLAAIRRIDAESRELFVTTFATIRAHFQEMFRKLFGGGKADVFLEEGQDVLEAGVEIMARPPGKELRSIALLSGGERTMTAVALMFAIYLAKPSPFCLLDEVDAALDESNVDRFVGAVAEFSEQSQFIIVTHNKRTMGSAGTIVGISMPEAGVSRKIAVRLEDVAADGQLRTAAAVAG